MRGAGAPGQRAHARHELGERERLRHVVVGAERQAVDEVVDSRGCREHQEAAVGLFRAQRPADVVAVHGGQVAVEHDDVIGRQTRLVERAGAVVRDVDGHALTPKPAGDRVCDPAFVLGQEHAHPKQGSEGEAALCAGDLRPRSLAAMSDSHLHEEPREALESALFEIKRVIIGQDAMLERVMVALLTGGHVPLEGVPRLAKTLTIKTLASVVGGSFSRIQFTPDLVPSNLVGTRVYRPDSGSFDAELGPVFANFLLADEINRAAAKVQSALLEVMQEQQVTIGGVTHPVPLPFLVLATQNPIESEGTYPLPEAQVDRFLMKILVDYPSPGDEASVVNRSLDPPAFVEERLTVADLLRFREAAADVIVDREVIDYAVALADATRRPDRYGLTDVAPLLSYGASPRGPIGLVQSARSLALLRGRRHVLASDIRDLAPEVLRHRLVLSYEGLSEGSRPDDLLEKVLGAVPEPDRRPVDGESLAA